MHPKISPRHVTALSLVEMLASVAIIGIISFLAIPNLVKMRSDSERNIAIARAEAINMGLATFIQVRGRSLAASDWAASTTDQLKYAKVAPYISFSELNLTDFMPNGYNIVFKTIDPLQKVTLRQGTTQIYY